MSSMHGRFSFVPYFYLVAQLANRGLVVEDDEELEMCCWPTLRHMSESHYEPV